MKEQRSVRVARGIGRTVERIASKAQKPNELYGGCPDYSKTEWRALALATMQNPENALALTERFGGDYPAFKTVSEALQRLL